MTEDHTWPDPRYVKVADQADFNDRVVRMLRYLCMMQSVHRHGQDPESAMYRQVEHAFSTRLWEIDDYVRMEKDERCATTGTRSTSTVK